METCCSANIGQRQPSRSLKLAFAHVDLPNETNGGVAHQAHELANALSQRGHEITMFTFSPEYAACNYRVHQFSRPRLPKRLFPFALAWRMARTDFSTFDLVHTHGDNYLMTRWHPQVRTFHGSAIDEARTATSAKRRLIQYVFILLERIGARVADVNVGVSRSTRDRIPRIGQIIPCGVDISRFKPLSTAEKSSNPSVLFVGTAQGRKRGQFLAEVFSTQVRPLYPNAELWAVSDRPLDGDGVVNHGRVSSDTLCSLFGRSWVFCLPSTYEGFGVPYIEAMASGTPVVASPNPGAREVLGDGEFGILSSDDDLGTHIGAILGDGPMRASYILRGIRRAQEFSWDAVASKYEALYAEVANK